jgi:putative component of membrane protein insertase Oxa1/YidC/SpoIIIJ protein YidD
MKGTFTMREETVSRGLRPRKWICGILVTCLVAFACARPVAVAAIGGYQRYLSPHKGYHCAHAALYGGLSCSEYGKQAIQVNGLAGGLILLRERFQACHEAAIAIRSGGCSSTEPRVEECFESDFNRGKREGQETKDYCDGCIQGCCSDQ